MKPCSVAREDAQVVAMEAVSEEDGDSGRGESPVLSSGMSGEQLYRNKTKI